MNTTWALQDAKNKFSEVVNQALSKGPQTITRHGKETAVVVSIDDFQKLTRPQGSMASFFQNSPLSGVKLDLDRHPDYGREIDL
ncbi:MAG: type II toxin-antitoxin system prevent-host-death family antitoxin [Candidatus Latescibacterota bacterium]|jgi:prevent-host-death family protein